MSNELKQKDITDSVMGRLTELKAEGLELPSNYSPQNALKSAYFALQKVKTNKNDGNKPALEVASLSSVANALLDMVIQGLSPAKTQCYFICSKDYSTNQFEIDMNRSYFGTQAVIKRLKDVDDIWAEVVHEGDKFEIESKNGRLIVKEFEPSFANLDNPIIGTYAVVKMADGEMIYTVMTKKQIDQSWSHAKTNKVQKEFPEEMAKRTVINRAAKNIINTSGDSDLLVESINDTTSNEYENSHDERKDVTPAEPTKIDSILAPETEEESIDDNSREEVPANAE